MRRAAERQEAHPGGSGFLGGAGAAAPAVGPAEATTVPSPAPPSSLPGGAPDGLGEPPAVGGAAPQLALVELSVCQGPSCSRLIRQRATGRRRSYCCPACKQAAFRARSRS